MKLIVGLGNPGALYEGNRHNIGFLVADRLAAAHHILISKKRFKTTLGKGLIESQEVVLIKPMTFMNRSGEAVKKALGDIDVHLVGDELPPSALAKEDGLDFGWPLMLIVLGLVAAECFMAMRFGHYRRQ